MVLSEQISFDNLAKEHQGYTKKAMPEVLQYLKDYEATGKYPYNAEVRDFILTKENIKPELHDYLETEVYLAQHDLQAEKLATHTHEMADKGYLPTSQLNGYLGQAELVATKSLDWMTQKLATTGKIITAHNGEPFFIPKGSRTRGYYIRNLENAFYKAI